MKFNWLPFVAVFALGTLLACEHEAPSDLSEHHLIPLPREVVAGGDIFTINRHTKIVFSTPVLEQHADLLAAMIGERSALDIGKQDHPGWKKSNRIRLIIEEGTQGKEENANSSEEGIRGGTEDPRESEDGKKGTEEMANRKEDGVRDRSIGARDRETYTLRIDKKNMVISAAHPEGIFRAITTFGQLLSTGAKGLVVVDKQISVPTGTINDWPEYAYRGTMLDVSRHFFGPEIVKRHIDLLAIYKINHLHLHLSDDQGWRIEIKSWPKLTEIGGSTEVGGGPGGFYTQEEYRDLVAYAAERYITIVPEIDMPGHTNAALASYPELNCDGRATQLYTGMRVGFSTLCTDREITYRFVDDVIREICGMTPGPYFHVGGDESHATALPDYIYFINRVREIVQSHGKNMIGWDEISHANLSEGDIAQYWASGKNAKRAADKGARIIMSPAKYCYLDMKYDSTTSLGLDWAGFIEVDDAYNWSPASLVDGIGKAQILGVESPLWAETIETADDIDFLAFPRLIGHAEIGWSDPNSLTWEDYRNRLKSHQKLLDPLGVNYYRSPSVW